MRESVEMPVCHPGDGRALYAPVREMRLTETVSRTLRGMPLPVVALIVATFAAIRLVDGDVRLVSLVRSGMTFFLLFLLLRLIDDIDDGPRPVGAAPLVLLILLTAAVVALNLADGRALAVAVAAVAAMVIVPFTLRGRLPQALLVIAYETVPALIMLYGSVSTARMRDWLTPLAVTALFWSGFEIWKWSRESDRSDRPRPHGLSRTAVRVWVIATYGVACAAILTVSVSMPDAHALLWYGPAATVTFAGLTAACWQGSGRPIGWRGLALMAVLDLGIFLQAIIAALT